VWERYYQPHADNVNLTILERHKIDLTWLQRAAPFIRKLYAAKRDAADTARAAVAKLALNSCYGRLGLRGEVEIARIVTRLPDGHDNEFMHLPDGRILYFFKFQRDGKVNYPLAAYITDNARGRLFAACKATTSASYVATDAIFCGGNIPTGDGIGDFKANGRELFLVNSPNVYKWGLETKRAGGGRRTEWTLRRLAAGGGAATVTPELACGVLKRAVNFDGTTTPFVVDGGTGKL
jgi:ribosomal protein L24E